MHFSFTARILGFIMVVGLAACVAKPLLQLIGRRWTAIDIAERAVAPVHANVPEEARNNPTLQSATNRKPLESAIIGKSVNRMVQHGDTLAMKRPMESQGLIAWSGKADKIKTSKTKFIFTKTKSWLLEPHRRDDKKSQPEARTFSVQESEGFVDEPDELWDMRKLRHREQRNVEIRLLQKCPHFEGAAKGQNNCVPKCQAASARPQHLWWSCKGNIFFQLFYEPSFGCLLEERVGHVAEGGKWVCNPHKLQDNVADGRTCLIYSIGDHDSYSFERAIHKEISTSCQIHALHHGQGSVPPPTSVRFHKYQVGRGGNARTIPYIANMLGHKGTTIDILIVDCNGCEWTTIRSCFGDGVYIRQILIRMYYLHEFLLQGASAVHAAFSFLFALGYVIFHKEPNLIKCHGRCVDYSFLKLSPQFSRSASTANTDQARSPLASSAHWSETSLTQSEGLMEVGNHDWNLVKQRNLHRMRLSRELLREDQCHVTLETHLAFCLPGCRAIKAKRCRSSSLWQTFYEPSLTCAFEKRIGAPGEGGKWLCNPHKLKTQTASARNCLVYSIGSHGEYDFESAVHDEVASDCEIHTIDIQDWRAYTSKSPPSYVNYHRYKVGDGGRGSTNLSTIVRELGHSHKTIDIFKIDCEGCEWLTFQHWFGEGVNIRQILVEVHHNLLFGYDESRIHAFFDMLFSLGYVIFQKEPNVLRDEGCVEYGFVKMSPSFVPSRESLD